MKNWLSHLQQKPYETRLKILWSTVLFLGIILVAIFVLNIKNTLSNINGKDLIKINSPGQSRPETTVDYVTVERIDQTAKVLQIYFNFNNQTDDILNVPKLADINLMIKNTQSSPQKITDRQGNQFVQKILSHTQNFGILTFTPANTDKATLTFDQMFFENTPSNIFQQKLNLDFNQLMKKTDVRN